MIPLMGINVALSNPKKQESSVSHLTDTCIRAQATAGVARGIFWIIAMTVVSNLNDVMMKFLGQRLPSVEVAFFRFLFGFITMIPVMLFLGKTSFSAKNWKAHSLRTIVGFAAIMLWCYGLTQVDLTVATTLSFTVPLFVLPLATIFLKEYVGLRRWLATIAGFVGILVVLNPTESSLNTGAILLLLSSAIFALSDVLGKKMIVSESLSTILFYFSLGACVLALGPALYVWQAPTLHEILLLVLLGVGCNLIQLCALKAFSATDVSVLSPFRYAELFIAIASGWFFFGESFTLSTALGAAVVIPATLYLAYYEIREKKHMIATAPVT